MTALDDARVHRCLLEFFFLEPCVAPTISSPQVWPAAVKWAKQLLSSWPGSPCLSLLASENSRRSKLYP